MKPARVTLRFPVRTAPGDLEPAIGVFHRFIQRGLVEGLILDVADYRHVPTGPGVLLVGHDVDYGLSCEAFTVVRKRSSQDDAATQFRDALRMGLGAIEALEDDGALDVAVDRGALTVEVPDRSLGAADEVAASLRPELQPAVLELFGEEAAMETPSDPDPRDAAAVTVRAPRSDGVLDALGGNRAPGQSPWDIAVEDLARLREREVEHVLIDVREENEYEIVNLGGQLIPLASLEGRLDELDRDAKIITHCRVGRRGALAVTQLRAAGFEDAWNVNGGIVAWADRIDPSLPRY